MDKQSQTVTQAVTEKGAVTGFPITSLAARSASFPRIPARITREASCAFLTVS